MCSAPCSSLVVTLNEPSEKRVALLNRGDGAVARVDGISAETLDVLLSGNPSTAEEESRRALMEVGRVMMEVGRVMHVLGVDRVTSTPSGDEVEDLTALHAQGQRKQRLDTVWKLALLFLQQCFLMFL